MNVPIATYRLQFNHTFTFKDALQIIPYLAELGISHIYASPVFKARKEVSMATTLQITTCSTMR
jgi:(1->4)-alpha-D-glucan 1-alpha-D-glucosylmutase